MGLYNTLKRYTSLAATTLALMATPKATSAATGSIDTIVGNSANKTEVRLLSQVTPKLNAFIRTTLTAPYTASPDLFAQVDLSYPLNSQISILADGQYLGGSLVPRLGLQYYDSFGNLSIFAVATGSIDTKPNVETLLELVWKPQTEADLPLYAQLEIIPNFGLDGHNFTLLTTKLGVQDKNLRGGLALMATQIGNKFSPEYNVGAFMGVDL